MRPRYDAGGQLAFWFVLPSKNLRRLLIAHLLKTYPQLNYGCEWKDARGWGLHLTVAHWVPVGHIYWVPD